MIKKQYPGLLLAILIVFSSLSAIAAQSEPLAKESSSISDTYKALNLFGDVFEQTRANYVEPVEDKKLIEYALNGMLSNLDPHSGFMNKKEAQSMSIQNKGEFELHEGEDKTKDQSYFLYNLGQKTLSHVILPLGKAKKSDVKKFAAELNLTNLVQKQESQGVCFYLDQDYVQFLKRYLPKKYFISGDIVDQKGTKIGTHNGLINYTIGQRKGVLVGGQKDPIYVIGFNLNKNQLILGNDEALWKKEIQTKSNHWINGKTPSEPQEIEIRIRHLTQKTKAVINNSLIHLHSPLRAITPGQSAVYYDGDKVLGGGIIV